MAVQVKKINLSLSDGKSLGQQVSVTHPNKLKHYYALIASFAHFLYNRKDRKAIGRDGLSWIKVSLCFFIFYAVLGGAFVAFLAIFATTLDHFEPRLVLINLKKFFKINKYAFNFNF
jgi:hypothetical protein